MPSSRGKSLLQVLPRGGGPKLGRLTSERGSFITYSEESSPGAVHALSSLYLLILNNPMSLYFYPNLIDKKNGNSEK